MSRHLVSQRRRVPPPLSARYDRSWSALHAAVAARGAHAWRFASAEDSTSRLEFLEFALDADPRSDPAVAAALRELDQVGPAEVEDWVGG